ncbi:hypothetical protein [Alteraurantiacibacter palmitatis]|uniref:Sugar transporter n=1 Tax=Alteraurantiacibacter palmitatis TaxID=2054628 RepID=A0ABV7EAR7_9SPHN
MSTERESTPVPWHLWVVGTLALLFTLMGAYDYVMSQTGNRAYMEAMVKPMGLNTDVAVAYFSGFPLWADAVWAIGVWGGVAGAALLLLRRALAYPMLLLSLAGLVLSNAYAVANPVPGMTDSFATYATVAIVFALMLGLALYARSMRRLGVLR